MSADIPEWERQLKEEVAELRRHSMELTQHIEAVRGRAEFQGIMVEVDGSGDLANLQIAPGAMRWASGQLASALVDCHRKARSDAKAKVEPKQTLAFATRPSGSATGYRPPSPSTVRRPRKKSRPMTTRSSSV